MDPLLRSKIGVREQIRAFAADMLREVTAPPGGEPDPATFPDNLLIIAYALGNDLPGYLAFANQRTDRPHILAVGRAAAASDHDTLLRLIPHLMANEAGPELAVAAIFLGDRGVCNDVSVVMYGLSYDTILVEILTLLAGTLEILKLECRFEEKVLLGGAGTRTAGQILQRLELLWQGQHPDDASPVHLNNNDKLRVLTAALAFAPEQ